jgi:hypothetical protein
MRTGDKYAASTGCFLRSVADSLADHETNNVVQLRPSGGNGRAAHFLGETVSGRITSHVKAYPDGKARCSSGQVGKSIQLAREGVQHLCGTIRARLRLATSMGVP